MSVFARTEENEVEKGRLDWINYNNMFGEADVTIIVLRLCPTNDLTL